MNLLIFSQKVDRKDSVLGFFHDWILRISQRVDNVYVICIEKGDVNLPPNVEVFSLGKQYGLGKINYLVNFWIYLYRLRGRYNKVFVHMNQEYVLLGGLYWFITKTPVYMWRNHFAGSFLTKIAVFLCNRVFYTSSSSYTARFNKSIKMPAGIDTEIFKPKDGVVRKKYSVGMIGRLSPVKNIDLGIRAVKILNDKGIQINMSIIGPVAEKDFEYVSELKKFISENDLSKIITFGPGVNFDKLNVIYSSIEICLNLTEAGSFDKTIVEASSCGAMPLVINESLRGQLPDICITTNNEVEIANSIEKLLQAGEQVKIHKELEEFVKSNSLENLMSSLIKIIK